MILSRKNTLIILDWDDTLFPTTWVTSASIDINNLSKVPALVYYFKNLDTEFRKLNKIHKPKCLIVNSIKGKGFKIMENKTHSHYWSPISKDRYLKSLEELREEYE